jgi:glycosyltransferase involved in cell wall biosynthesis
MLTPEIEAPVASVLICTRNRARSLERTLASLSMIDSSDISWELIIVDNGSTDATASVIDRFNSRLPVTRVEQPNPGLSNARNAGVLAARGKYIIWTDDDVLVDRGWLRSYVAAFTKWPDAAVFGGKTVPVFEQPEAEWMIASASSLMDLLAIRDFGIEPVALRGPVTPFGLNYAVRAIEQRQHMYDPSLGVAPGRRTGGEETSVISSILRTNVGFWIPDALILHIIPAERQTVAYVREYYEARGTAMAGWEDSDESPRWFRIPRWRFRRLILSYVGYIFYYTLRKNRWVPQLRDYSIQKGWIATRYHCRTS